MDAPSYEQLLRENQQLRELVAQLQKRIEELEQQTKAAASAYQKAAGELSASRRKAARELKRAIEQELNELAMAGTQFEARLTAGASDAGAAGAGAHRV